MNIHEIAEKTNLTFIVESDREIKSGYASDLLSIVMNKAQSESVWLTVQTHKNIVAVAKMTDIGAIVVCDGFTPDADTIESARKENIALLKSEDGIFALSGRLSVLGIK